MVNEFYQGLPSNYAKYFEIHDLYFLQHALCIFRHQIRVSRQRFKTQKQNLLFLPQKRDIHDNIESKKRCNDASFANYKTGYFSFVYLIGDKRHHIAGDSLRTDSLNLVDSIRIYTSLYKTFNAGSVTYSREVNYKWNTLCLPYTFNASRNSTADFYEIKKNSNDTIYLSRINGTVEAGVPVIACKKANNDKIVINATNVQVVENPINVFQNNYYFIGNFTTNSKIGFYFLESILNIIRIITNFSWYCFWGVFILILAGIFELQRKKLLKYGAKTHKKIKLVSFLFSNKCKRSKIQGLYLKI